MSARTTRLSAWWTRLALVATAVCLAALLAEIGLRVAGFSYLLFGQPDAMRGVSLRPGASGWQTIEGVAYVRINSAGYRDREHAKVKPDGVYRIAVLGDSFVEAEHVPLEHTFCAVLERMLNAHSPFGGKSVEVLNFGVDGYGTAQELLTLRKDVYAYAPDLVILAVFTGNDAADNSQTLSHRLRARPYFVLQGDTLTLDNSFLQSETFRDRQSLSARVYYATREYSRLVQLAIRAREGFQRRASAHAAPNTEPGLEDPVYREPSDRTWQEAWQITDRLIGSMFEEVRQRGIAFGVVTLSNPIQVYPDVSVRNQFMHRVGVDDLFYPDRRIKSLGDRAGFPVDTLAPGLQAYADAHHVFLHGFKNTTLGFGHWNEDGHQVAATLIAEWIAETSAASRWNH